MPAAPAASAIGEDSRQLACLSSGEGGSSGAGREKQESEHDALELTVQVWDEDEGAAADFLGELQFNAQALLDMGRDRLDLVRLLDQCSSRSVANSGRQIVRVGSAKTVCFKTHIKPLDGGLARRWWHPSGPRAFSSEHRVNWWFVPNTAVSSAAGEGRFLIHWSSIWREGRRVPLPLVLANRFTGLDKMISENHAFFNALVVEMLGMQVLPLEAKHDGSMTKEQRQLVQGSVGLRVSPATDGALSRLQESIDVKKVFLEVTTPRVPSTIGSQHKPPPCFQSYFHPHRNWNPRTRSLHTSSRTPLNQTHQNVR